MKIISMEKAARPDFTDRQVKFCRSLIGMGLSRLAIASLLLGVDQSSLNPSQVTAVNRLIQKQYKELGHNIVDARNVRSPFMADAVSRAASSFRLKVKIA